MRQYQPWTRKEAIGTHTSAALLQMQINMLTKSPLLRMIPGSGVLKERADFKRRQRYEETGRDESGRKLTKQEFEDREKRRKDLGALASIQEMLQKLLIDKKLFVPVQIMDPKKDMGGGKQHVVANMGGDIIPLEGEEAQVEAEKAKQEENDRMEKKQESFFTKLFGGKKKERGDGGILGALLGMLTPLLNLFKGGMEGLASSLIKPLLSAMGLSAASLGSLVAAIFPLAMAAGVGLYIRHWLNRETEEKERASKARGMRGQAKGYAIQDKEGKYSFKTAQDLGTTDEDIASGKFTTEGLNTTPMVMETQDGKLTGRLADQFPQSKEATELHMKATMKENAAIGGAAALGGDFQDKLRSLQYGMEQATSFYDANIGNIADRGTGQEIADRWNAVRDLAESIVNDAGKRSSDLKKVAMIHVGNLVKNYPLFKNLTDGKVFHPSRAKYGQGGDAMTSLYMKSSVPGMLARIGMRLVNAPDPAKSQLGVLSLPGAIPADAAEGGKSLDTHLYGTDKTGNDVKGLSDGINAIRDMIGMAQPTIIAPTANTVAQTNTAVSSGGPSARTQTGAERSVNFSGGMQVVAFA